MCRLINYSPFPPGGFPYKQTEGLTQNFPDVGLDIKQQAELVYQFRLKNSLPGADFGQCVVDIDLYTCNRLGCMPQYCFDGVAPTPPTRGGGGGCSTCGGPHVG